MTEREISEMKTDDEFIGKLAENFSDLETPLKIRKIELFQELGLPTSNIDVFKPQELAAIKEKITERRNEGEKVMLIRFACIPDAFSMPTRVIEEDEDIDTMADELSKLIRQYSQIKNIILTSYIADTEAADKISGRYMVENMHAAPVEASMELYKGSRTTGVLNNPRSEDPNFLHFTQNIGTMMKLDAAKKEECTISDTEVKDVYSLLSDYSDRLLEAQKVIAKAEGRTIESMITIFEFSYTKGRFVFSDIDYA